MAAPGLDPKIDYLFKRLFGSEDNVFLLIDLLNAVLTFPAGRPVRQIEIKNPLTLKAHPEAKAPILDIKANDQLSRQFHLEMQLAVPFSFAQRALYYWAGLHASQMVEGDDYETLCPTYTLCFVNQTMFRDEAYHHVFEMVDARHGLPLCKDGQIHILELNKFHVPVEEVQTAKERWCYFLRHGATLDPERLPAALDTPLLRQALEVLMAVSRDEAERWLLHDIQVGIRDRTTLANDARRVKEELHKAQVELQVAQQESQKVQLEKEKAQQEKEKAQQEKEKAQQEKEKAQQEKEKAQQEKEKAQQEKEKAQQEARSAVDKAQLVGSVRSFQELLRQPMTPVSDLFSLSMEELAHRVDQLKQLLLAPRNGTN